MGTESRDLVGVLAVVSVLSGTLVGASAGIVSLALGREFAVYGALGTVAGLFFAAGAAMYFAPGRCWMQLLIHPGSREDYVLGIEPSTFTAEREETNAGTVVKVFDSNNPWPDEPAFLLSVREAELLAETIRGEVPESEVTQT